MKKCVIIGSGLGGLACGAILAKNGHRVTVLEKEHQPGGCLQCFHRGGVKFETGMHFVGSAAPGQTLDRLLRYLEIKDRVQLSPLDKEGYEVVSLEGHHYRLANGREAFIKELSASFPSSVDELNRYYDLIERVAHASSLHNLSTLPIDDVLTASYLLRSIDEVMNEIVRDEQLRNVLMGTLPLYAAEWGKTPFSVHAFVTDFYQQSAYRIVGGSDHIARSLIETIEKYGGKVVTRQSVSAIVCDDTHAIGVTTADEKLWEADFVISDLHPQRTMELTASPLLRPAYRRRIATLPNTVGCFTVYLKFKPHTVPYMNSNFFGYRQASPWNCEQYTEADWPMGYLYMHFCNEDGQRYAESGQIISYMRYEEVEKWENTRVGHRGTDYEAFKKEHAERLIAAVEEEFPGLASQIESYYTSTPLTYRDYTGAERGGMYGIAKDISLGPASRVHHRTKIPNLLLTGQNINSHGVLGVLVGTLVTCGEIIGAEALGQIGRQPCPRA